MPRICGGQRKYAKSRQYVDDKIEDEEYVKDQMYEEDDDGASEYSDEEYEEDDIASNYQTILNTRAIGAGISKDSVQIGLDVTNPKKHITRVFRLDFCGSALDFSANPSLAVWRPVTSEIFKKRTVKYVDGKAKQDFDSESDVSKCIIIEAKVRSKKNTGPIDVAIDFPAMAGNVFTKYGKAHNIVIDKHTRGSPEGISSMFQAGDMIQNNMLAQYGHLDIDDIRSKVVPLPDEDGAVMVRKENPIMNILRKERNIKAFKLNPRAFTECMKGYYKVDEHLVNICIDSMQRKLFDVFPFVDFNNIEAHLSRVDQQEWNDAQTLQQYGKMSKNPEGYVSNLLEVPFDVSAEIEMTYVLVNDIAKGK